MLLADIANDTRVFIDSNIFIYHFSNFEPFAASCLKLFQRIEDGDISGYTSTVVLAEVLHRLMVIEAAKKFYIQPKNVVKYLKENPNKISSLTDHPKSLDFIERIGVTILPVNAHDLKVSIDLKKEFGLLTIDAINVSVIKNNDLAALASNDGDYDRVKFLTQYRP